MKIMEWIELSRKLAYQKYSRKIEEVIFKLPNGKASDFYIKSEGPASCILALTPKNEVVLVKQFRPGVKKILMELPGGFVDKQEEPINAAIRELREETGYEGDFQFVGISLDDAYSTMERFNFVATNCHKVTEPKRDPNEEVEPVLMPLDRFRKHLRSGQLTDIESGYLGLDFLGLLNVK